MSPLTDWHREIEELLDLLKLRGVVIADGTIPNQPERSGLFEQLDGEQPRPSCGCGDLECAG